MNLDLFIETLACYNKARVFNPWRDRDPHDREADGRGIWPWVGPEGRIGRLRNHLDRDADFMLIGEAPGYQGCHFSGVPFVSEALVIHDRIPGIIMQGSRITTRERPFAEPSATIVWGALQELGIQERTVCWNAFPWHPHEDGDLLSNRTPTAEELAPDSAAGVCLHAIIDLFPYTRLVTVGNNARDLFESLKLKADHHIRHPANGGATKFREGLSNFVRSIT